MKKIIAFHFIALLLFPGIGAAALGDCYIVLYQKNGAPFAAGPYGGGYQYLELNQTDGNLSGSDYVDTWPSPTMLLQAYFFKSYRRDGTAWVPVIGRSYLMPVSTALSHVPSEKLIEDPTGNFDSTVLTISGCPSSCSAKSGQSNYSLEQHLETSIPSTQDKCYEDCRQTVEILWEDCINGSCVSSMKYTYTGDICTGQPGVNSIQPDPPQRCNDELLQLITQCGGTLNVQSFDFETCTGECTPDSCQTEYAELLNRCGGFMGIATWDKTTCKGTCTSDPLPEPPTAEQPPPAEISIIEKTNPDGSKETSQTTTYVNDDDGYTYTTTTTTTYDASGGQTGQTVTSVRSTGGDSTGENDPGETFGSIGGSGFGESYAPGGEYDIPTRFNSFLSSVQSSGLFSFSSGFFDSIPGGGSPVYTINGGQTFGSHSIDLSETMTTGLAILKTILLACFAFLSIRAIIMKR